MHTRQRPFMAASCDLVDPVRPLPGVQIIGITLYGAATQDAILLLMVCQTLPCLQNHGFYAINTAVAHEAKSSGVQL